MRVITLPFIDGKFELKLLAFRRKNNCFVMANGEYFQPTSLKDIQLDALNPYVGGGRTNMHTLSNEFNNQNINAGTEEG
jgi:putative N-acetylmannosamine-6-phosphate epimerase